MDLRRRELTLAAIVFLLPVLLHLRTVGFGFIWDDDANVTANALLFGEDQLRRIWTGQDIYQYYPLTFTSYWLQDRLFGLSPAACHTVNVGLHGLVSVGLYSVLRRLAVPGAFWGAVLFAVHPMATETVAWITERKNLLAGLFAVGSVRAYLEFAGIGGFGGGVGRGVGSGVETGIGSASRSGRYYALALLLFVLAALSKTHVVVLPAFFLLLEIWRRRRTAVREAVRLLPFFVVSGVLSLLTIRFEARHVLRDGAEWEWAFSLPERIVIAGKILTFYLFQTVRPYPLAFIHDPWVVDATRPAEWIPVVSWGLGLILLGILAAAVRGRSAGKSGGRFALPSAALFVCAAYVLWLLPVLGFLRVYFMRYAFVQDHFAYFALLVLVPGLAAGIAWCLGAAGSMPVSTSRRGLVTAVFTLLTVASMTLTWRHQEDFRDIETLWTRTVEKSPRAWMAWTNLGVLRSAQQRHGEAAELHRRGIEIDDRRAEPHNNLGFALEALGDFEGAIDEYRRGTEIEPDDPVAYYNMGNALVRAGRLREAMGAYESALARNREYPQALNGLGVALARSDRMQAAAEHWAEALVVAPGFQDAYGNLSRVLEQELTVGASVDMMRRVSEATGRENPAIEVLLSRAWLRVGDFQEATLAVDRADAAAHDLGIGWLETVITETRLAMQ